MVCFIYNIILLYIERDFSFIGTSDSSSIKLSKQMKLSSSETNSIKVLVNAYREAASYLSRSADELEQLI